MSPHAARKVGQGEEEEEDLSGLWKGGGRGADLSAACTHSTVHTDGEESDGDMRSTMHSLH